MTTKITLPDYVVDIMQMVKQANFKIYIVGGAIRDYLLGKNTDNWDFATSATPEQIQSLFKHSIYNNNFGTVIVPIKKDGKIYSCEITPFRKESEYTDHRHPSLISWAKTIEEDLIRRDFTINALAYDGKSIIDITHGISDLKHKLIRAVGNPAKRFQEDGLRLMRAIRFATTLGFSIEPITYKAISENSKLLQTISWERINQEFMKIIASNQPADGILFLKNTNLLQFILPELNNCFGVEQKSPNRHHIYDVGLHLIESLRACTSTDPIVRLACLLHDIGKSVTYNIDPETKTITFYNHEVAGSHMIEELSKRLRLSNAQSKKLLLLVKYHMFSTSEHQTDKTIRRLIRQVGAENIRDLLEIRRADRIGSGAKESSWRLELFKKRIIEVQKIPFQITDLKIDGKDIMKICNIKPGPQVGKILHTLFVLVEEKKIKNTKKDLTLATTNYCNTA